MVYIYIYQIRIQVGTRIGKSQKKLCHTTESFSTVFIASFIYLIINYEFISYNTYR